MENLTFRTWAYAQAVSFATAMAKTVPTELKVENPVRDILDLFEKFDRYDVVDTYVFGNFVITINKKARKLGLLNTRSGKFVETYCNKKDTFDSIVGLGILWAKYNNVERPKLVTKKRLSELEPHTIFERNSNEYEFIGEINHSSSMVKYVAYYMDSRALCKFVDETVLVEE